MSLVRLPYEILKDIFSRLDVQSERRYADNGYPTLCALALTCRRISSVANNLLYTHVKFEVNGPSAHAKDEERTRIFNKCCQNNPYLLNRIKSMELRWYSEAGLYNELLETIAKSTSLRKLQSNLSHWKWREIPALYDYTDGSFPELRELEIALHDVGGKEGYLPAEQVAKLCELPSLDTLTIIAPVGGFRTDVKREAMLPKLRSLQFYQCRPVSVDVLTSILPRAPNLTCLELSAPGDATEVNRKMSNDMSSRGYDLDEPLRPSFYGKLISTTVATLKHLTIDTDNVLFPSHDESRIDLSAFMNMSSAVLSPYLLFGDGSTASCSPWAREAWKILPPRLERLDLLFQGEMGLFWSLSDMRSHARAKTFELLWEERLMPHHVDWLVDLMKNLGGTNSLRHLTLMADALVDRDQNWKVVKWFLTDHLRAVARAARVELEITLLVPRTFDDPEFEVIEEAGAYGLAGTVDYEHNPDQPVVENDNEDF
ncbi:hypothetical protein GGS26DRAFT_381957 [Hypomontagnella submonticulosa]|nr:hypothetical protein GGS26DRAFT_381957 [Hypomontagnella submonticulosa]